MFVFVYSYWEDLGSLVTPGERAAFEFNGCELNRTGCFCVAGQRATNSSQPEETLCPGPGNQSEKGPTFYQFSHITLKINMDSTLESKFKQVSCMQLLMSWWAALFVLMLVFVCAECRDGFRRHGRQRGTKAENILSWEQSWAAHQGSQTGGSWTCAVLVAMVTVCLLLCSSFYRSFF